MAPFRARSSEGCPEISTLDPIREGNRNQQNITFRDPSRVVQNTFIRSTVWNIKNNYLSLGELVVPQIGRPFQKPDFRMAHFVNVFLDTVYTYMVYPFIPRTLCGDSGFK